MADERRATRLPFLIASLLSLAWLAFALWFLVEGGGLAASLPTIVATALAPVAAFFAIAAAVPAPARADSETSDPLLADSLAASDERLRDLVGRVEALRASLAAERQGLDEVLETMARQEQSIDARARALGESSTLAMEQCARLDSTLPAARATIEALTSALAEATAGAGRQADAAASASASLTSHLAELAAAGDSASERIAEARDAGAALAKTLRSEADSLFQTLEQTQTARIEHLARQGEALQQQLADGYQRLESLAAAAAGPLAGRLQELASAAERIESRLKSNQAATDSLVQAGERSFQLLDARISHHNDTSSAALERLSARVQGLNGELSSLAQPIRDTGAATTDLQQQVAALHTAAEALLHTLGDGLTARAEAAKAATGSLAGEVAQLDGSVEAAATTVDRLATVIAGQQQAIAALNATSEEQQQRVAAATAQLTDELTKADSLAGAIDTRLRDTSLSTASGLVEAIGQARTVVTQVQGAMREVLDRMLEDADGRLRATATKAVEESFVQPVADKANEASALATAAAERTARSLALLTDVLSKVDAQVDSRTAALEAQRQQDLLAASSLLSEELSSAAVSIASALGKPMDDSDWAKWRKGERGLFQRRALALLDRDEARNLQQLLAENGEFTAHARAYTAAFDSLLQRLDGLAPGLSSALRGSDSGRLAAALAEALAG